MAQCWICGDEHTARFRPRLRRTVCDGCAHGMKPKVSRERFDEVYWGPESGIPESTRREFYEDYLSSTGTLDEYMAATINSPDSFLQSAIDEIDDSIRRGAM